MLLGVRPSVAETPGTSDKIFKQLCRDPVPGLPSARRPWALPPFGAATSSSQPAGRGGGEECLRVVFKTLCGAYDTSLFLQLHIFGIPFHCNVINCKQISVFKEVK